MAVVDDPNSSLKAVTVLDLGATPAMLIRGPGLTPGPLNAATEEPRALFPGDQQVLALSEGDSTVEIQSVGAAGTNRWGRVQVSRYGLQARVDGKPITLLPELELRKRGDVPSVLFAADLDRDGKLDLVVDTSTHYNLVEQRVFLSSPAKKKGLVEVASSRQQGG